MSLGHAIRALAAAQGKTQDQIAEAAGMDRAMLSRIVTGNTSPTFETLERIASAFGLPLCWLVLLAMDADDFRDEPAALTALRAPIVGQIFLHLGLLKSR